MQDKYEQQAIDMRRFYDFDRFDIDFVSDAILFNKHETSAPANQVVVTAPGARVK